MLPNGTKKTLCQSLVQSHVDYAISSWYTAMSKKAKNKLQIIQNKMIRFILDLGPRTHITNKHMLDLNLLKIPGRVQQLRLNITHKIYYKKAPTYLQANFHKNRDRTQRTSLASSASSPPSTPSFSPLTHLGHTKFCTPRRCLSSEHC